MLTPVGRVAQIDVEEGDRPTVVKQRLQEATGVPAADMKLRLCGSNQMVMIDTISNIKVGSCGVTHGAPRRVRSQQRAPLTLLLALLSPPAAVQEVDAGIPLPQSFNYS